MGVLSVTPSSSHSFPAPLWCPSHRIRSFTNCSSMGPLPRLKFSTKELLQRRSPAGHSSCRNLLLCVHCTGRSFLQDTSTCCRVGSSTGYSVDPPWAAGAQPVSPCSSPWATAESLLGHLEHLHPSFFFGLGVCMAASHTFSPHSLLASVTFCSFLNTLSRDAPTMAAGLSCSLQLIFCDILLLQLWRKRLWNICLSSISLDFQDDMIRVETKLYIHYRGDKVIIICFPFSWVWMFGKNCVGNHMLPIAYCRMRVLLWKSCRERNYRTRVLDPYNFYYGNSTKKDSETSNA